jgi:hypothetical protein
MWPTVTQGSVRISRNSSCHESRSASYVAESKRSFFFKSTKLPTSFSRNSVSNSLTSFPMWPTVTQGSVRISRNSSLTCSCSITWCWPVVAVRIDSREVMRVGLLRTLLNPRDLSSSKAPNFPTIDSNRYHRLLHTLFPILISTPSKTLRALLFLLRTLLNPRDLSSSKAPNFQPASPATLSPTPSDALLSILTATTGYSTPSSQSSSLHLAKPCGLCSSRRCAAQRESSGRAEPAGFC